jgi:hypothetical protein
MRRSFVGVLLSLSSVAAVLLGAAETCAQGTKLDGGAALSTGIYNPNGPSQGGPVAGGVAALFCEWREPRHLSWINLGLEVREERTMSTGGVLVGPYVSGNEGRMHAFAGARFGPAHVIYTTPGIVVNPPSVERRGVTSEAVLGLDVDISEHFRWRVFEVSAGSFSGVASSNPVAFQTGLTFHLHGAGLR